MSIVERLATKWAAPIEGVPSSMLDEPYAEQARWWLNAIAEELEAADPGSVIAGDPKRWHFSMSAAWLREQAGEMK